MSSVVPLLAVGISLITLFGNICLSIWMQRQKHKDDISLARIALRENLKMDEAKAARERTFKLRNRTLEMLDAFDRLTDAHLSNDDLVKEVTAALQTHANFKSGYRDAKYDLDETRINLMEAIDDSIVSVVLDLARDTTIRNSAEHRNSMDVHKKQLDKHKSKTRSVLDSYLPTLAAA